MRILIIVAFTFLLIVLSIINNISVLYPLICTLIIFGADALHRGFGIKDISNMAVDGVKSSAIIYKVFALIGAIISVWMACGTVPGLMYYGFSLVKPENFVVTAFLLTSAVSMLLGTSFGTVSTIGVAIMAVGRGFGINPSVIAGAVISGAYLGDRSSPMSSSALLTSAVTGSKLYDNLKYMMHTLMPAFVISLILYGFTGSIAGVRSYDLARVVEIQQALKAGFNISVIVLFPPLIIMVLSMFKIDIKINMLVGIIAGCIIAVFVQGIQPYSLLKYAVMGYDRAFDDAFLSGVIKGGGVISMVKAGLIIAVSSALNGILQGTGMMDSMLDYFNRSIKTTGDLILKSAGVGIITAMYGCNQTLSIMMTVYIIKPAFEKHNLSDVSLARTIADTSVVLSPMVPWNIAGLVPAVNMGVRAVDFIPYAYLCLVLPAITIIYGYMGCIKKDASIMGASC